jgi:hypothetical protein
MASESSYQPFDQTTFEDVFDQASCLSTGIIPGTLNREGVYEFTFTYFS